MLFSSPQYPLFLAAVFFLYGLSRSGRWPGSLARLALMVLLGDVVYVLLTHEVASLWDPIGGVVLAIVSDTPMPSLARMPVGLAVLGGAVYLGLQVAGRAPGAPSEPPRARVAPGHHAATARVVRRKGKKGKGGKGKPVPRRGAPVAPAPEPALDPAAAAAAERTSVRTAHVLAGVLAGLGLVVAIGAWLDVLDACSAALAAIGHLVYLVGLGFALGAALTPRGRHLGRVLVLGLVSAVFYHAWAAGQVGAYRYLLALIAATIVLDFYLARAIENTERPGWRLFYLLTSLISNLGILAVFKYADFIRLDVLQLDAEPWRLILPAGISFHTFQSLSYTIDVYRREIKATRSVVELATFVLFFPQLVAGPIVRAVDLLPQLKDLPLFDHGKAADGLFRILVGLAKKIALADFLGDALADRVFADPSLYSSAEVAAGVVAYAFQIYLDFSAYSDIAIGSAQLLGFTLPENFRTPYRSTSLQEFWRRWHISLSSWLRDYLYIPLGGNRGSEWTTYRNLILTMLLGGLWHGANWTFIVWGLLHGGGLAVTRLYQRATARLRVLAGCAVVFVVGGAVHLLLPSLAPWTDLALAWAYGVPLWAAATAWLESAREPEVTGTPRPRLVLALRGVALAAFVASLGFLQWGPRAAVVPLIVVVTVAAWLADVATIGPRPDVAARWLLWAVRRAAAVVLVFAYVCLAWIFFRAQTFDQALAVLRRLGAGEWDTPNLVPIIQIALAAALASHWFAPRTFAWMRARFVAAHWIVQGLVLAAAALVLRELAHPTIVPFIYFQF